MGRADFIPQSHDAFFTWQSELYDRLMEKQGSFKIDEAKAKPLTAAKSNYDKAFGRAGNPDSANRADRVERNRCEKEYKAEIRKYINENIRYNSNVGDYDRQYLGLNIPDTTPTPVAIPATHPVLSIDFSQPLQHTVHIKDELLDSNRKPEGVRECEIWYAIAEEQPKVSELLYVGSSSKSTFLVEFDSDDEGKKVWYRAKWINTRGQHGAWGVYTSARIA